MWRFLIHYTRSLLFSISLFSLSFVQSSLFIVPVVLIGYLNFPQLIIHNKIYRDNMPSIPFNIQKLFI